jgi:alpha-tubulin suppressor-like RCC1 family protein
MRRILAAAAVVLVGVLVGVGSPAQAASGPWAKVSGGGLHTYGVNAAKSLYCWGNNSAGQIGDGSTTNRSAPVRIGTAGAWASVSGGDSHTCAVSTGKSLYCWGYNAQGQVGDGTTTQRNSPNKIA